MMNTRKSELGTLPAWVEVGMESEPLLVMPLA